MIVLADPCRPLGTVTFSNAPTATSFDCDSASGSMLILHRPTADKSLAASGKYPYGEHMHGRKRLWEYRWQVSFKTPVQGQVFIGLEQDKYEPVSWAKRCVGGNVVAALRHGSGGTMYQSYGDDPAQTKGEVERPAVVFLLSIVDQLVVTPSGEMPPSLSDPSFSSFGITKANSRSGFRTAMAGLELVPGPTYTFGFWCVSQFADAIGWRAPARNLLPAVKFRDLGVFPPCYFVMYALKPRSIHEQNDCRHLDSNKVYAFRSAYWSTLEPPDAARARELQHVKNPMPVAQEKTTGHGFFGCCF